MPDRTTEERLKKRTAALESRLYYLVCLVSAGTVFAVLLPVNLVQPVAGPVNAAIVTFGVTALALLLLERRGHHAPSLYVGVLFATLTVCWFFDGGSHGSVGAYFELGLLVALTITRGRARIAWVAIWAVDLVALHVAEYLRPQWVHLLASRLDHLVDAGLGLLVCGVGAGAIMWGILAAYRRDRRELGKLAQELAHKAAEIRTLRGMLPICAWCKKVRTDAGLWMQLEQYMTANTEAMISHALCPDCAREHFRDVLADEETPT